MERHRTIINWCTYDPLLELVAIPNPRPNAVENHPANLVGPVLSDIPGTKDDAWRSTIVKITPSAAAPTDYSTFYQTNANGYEYVQHLQFGAGPLDISSNRDVRSPYGKLKALPNPATEFVLFEWPLQMAEGWLELINAYGQKMHTARISGLQYRFERNVLTPGVYYYRIMNAGNTTWSGKIVLN